MTTTREAATDLVEAQVIAAGVSYFSKEKVQDSAGQVRKDQQGNEVSVELRHEALHGEVVKMSQHEFDRLAALGAVREPSSAPLRPAQQATPFGVPLRYDNDPEQPLSAFAGPVMGDPRPAGAGTDPTGLDRVGPGARPLTADEARALEAQARGANADGTVEDIEGMSAEEVREVIDEGSLSVEGTLALARGEGGELDPIKAELVLEAELSREKPRKGVFEPLEQATEGE